MAPAATPRLSRLELCKRDFSWKSPLLRGLKHLEIRTPFERPNLSDWLDGLTKCHNSRRFPYTWLPRLLLMVPHSHLMLSAPSHSPPLHSSKSPPLRKIVGSHSHISSYRLSPRCASSQNLVAGTAATCKTSSRTFHDTPTDPRIPTATEHVGLQ